MSSDGFIVDAELELLVRYLTNELGTRLVASFNRRLAKDDAFLALATPIITAWAVNARADVLPDNGATTHY